MTAREYGEARRAAREYRDRQAAICRDARFDRNVSASIDIASGLFVGARAIQAYRAYRGGSTAATAIRPVGSAVQGTLIGETGTVPNGMAVSTILAADNPEGPPPTGGAGVRESLLDALPILGWQRGNARVTRACSGL
jgi:hypothetical protein